MKNSARPNSNNTPTRTKPISKRTHIRQIIREGEKSGVLRFIRGAQDQFLSEGERGLRKWLRRSFKALPDQDAIEILTVLLATFFTAEEREKRKGGEGRFASQG